MMIDRWVNGSLVPNNTFAPQSPKTFKLFPFKLGKIWERCRILRIQNSSRPRPKKRWPSGVSSNIRTMEHSRQTMGNCVKELPNIRSCNVNVVMDTCYWVGLSPHYATFRNV